MPVTTTGSYNDLDIRDAVIEGGGSVPSAFSWEDLVDAADWSKFHPSYLDGATSKAEIVHDGQFRGYPYSSPCPNPIFMVTYHSHSVSALTVDYILTVTNVGTRDYYLSFSGASASVISDDGLGSIRIRKNMTDSLWVNIYFEPGGACGMSETTSQSITPMQGMIGRPGSPDPAVVTQNKYCVDGGNPSDYALLTSSAPSGGTPVWNDGRVGSSMGILFRNGSFWAWVINSSGASSQSVTLTVGIC